MNGQMAGIQGKVFVQWHSVIEYNTSEAAQSFISDNYLTY